MSCLNPITALDFGIQDNGKRKIRILRPGEGLVHDMEEARLLQKESRLMNIMFLPCGHCVACAQDYARTWQLRILCEAQYYEKKCFVTLTYKDEVKPNKEDARRFIKAVRNKYGQGIKFFLCGELGSHTKRFHLHAILFGCDFMEDAQPIGKRGLNLVYSSKTLDSLWKKGFTSLGTLDVSSAGYVSKYCDKKKITREDDGEFIIMSRGLARRYFMDHKKEIFDSDYIYLEGNRFKIPRYFLKLADADGFYMSCLADDYRIRKINVAQHFRYDKCRSVNREEDAVVQCNKIAMDKYKHEEAVRDVF